MNTSIRNPKFDSAVYNTVDEIATSAIFWKHSIEQIDRDVDVAFNTIELCFPEFSVADTVTRSLAKHAVLELQLKYTGEVNNFSAVCDYVTAGLDIEEILLDVYGGI